MAKPNNLERLMLRLVNNERDEAGDRGLRFNWKLNDAAEDHSEWMIRRDIFDHTGASGSSPRGRMVDAGYRFSGTTLYGENIVAVPSDHDGKLADEVREGFRLLMGSAVHRANILKDGYRDIGIGIEFGKFKFNGVIADAVVITQDFARSSANNSRTPPSAAMPDAFAFRSFAGAEDQPLPSVRETPLALDDAEPGAIVTAGTWDSLL
jgi:serralysin